MHRNPTGPWGPRPKSDADDEGSPLLQGSWSRASVESTAQTASENLLNSCDAPGMLLPLLSARIVSFFALLTRKSTWEYMKDHRGKIYSNSTRGYVRICFRTSRVHRLHKTAVSLSSLGFFFAFDVSTSPSKFFSFQIVTRSSSSWLDIPSPTYSLLSYMLLSSLMTCRS